MITLLALCLSIKHSNDLPHPVFFTVIFNPLMKTNIGH